MSDLEHGTTDVTGDSRWRIRSFNEGDMNKISDLGPVPGSSGREQLPTDAEDEPLGEKPDGQVSTNASVEEGVQSPESTIAETIKRLQDSRRPPGYWKNM